MMIYLKESLKIWKKNDKFDLIYISKNYKVFFISEHNKNYPIFNIWENNNVSIKLKVLIPYIITNLYKKLIIINSFIY